MIDEPMFKKGSYPAQQSDGLYMDGALVELVEIYARNIVKDNQFAINMGSSTFGVRTGKSTLAQQICYYYTYRVNKLHGLDIIFDHRNIVFNSEDLIKRAAAVPRYSALILDEGDDLTEHAFSKTMKDLQKFFRKSGQLNLFIILILPSFFDCPKFLAMNRTNAFIDVKFEGEFDRGYFEYYNFTDKKKLYVKGKKFHDYDVQRATIPNGRFVNKYCVDEEIYRKMKLDDFIKKDDEIEEKIPMKVYRKIESEIFTKVFKAIKMDMRGKISVKKMAKYFGRSERTCHRFLTENEDEIVRLIKRGNFERDDGILAESNDTIDLTKEEGEVRDTTEGEGYIEDGDEQMNDEK